MILNRLREIATNEASNILSEVCDTLSLQASDSDIELEVDMLTTEFILLAKCKHCGAKLEIATLPYSDKERWLPIISRAVSRFEEAWARHLARHVALRRIKKSAT